ncbi:MAG: N-acetylmuramoyl-L-alanine amidase-like domain-containing protein [bacterium]
MKKLFIFICMFVYVQFFAQDIYTEQDSVVCKNKFEIMSKDDLSQLPIGMVIAAVGKSFIGTPYVPNTLEQGDVEKLVINLTGLDCTTFLETTFTLSRCIKKNKTTFENYKNELKFIRYRDGILDGYPSRLHYTSDWIINNQKKGIVKNVSQEIGGVVYNKQVFFMSKNADKYQILKANPQFVPQILDFENEINEVTKYYIPKDKIASVEEKINTGDFIGLTTTIEGMDVSHVGIAIKQTDGHIYFLHAPNIGKKVQLTTITLSEYVANLSKNTGIIVFRPEEIK